MKNSTYGIKQITLGAFSARLGFGSARLGSARPGPARPGPARLGPARPSSTRPRLARLGPAWVPTHFPIHSWTLPTHSHKGLPLSLPPSSRPTPLPPCMVMHGHYLYFPHHLPDCHYLPEAITSRAPIYIIICIYTCATRAHSMRWARGLGLGPRPPRSLKRASPPKPQGELISRYIYIYVIHNSNVLQ